MLTKCDHVKPTGRQTPTLSVAPPLSSTTDAWDSRRPHAATRRTLPLSCNPLHAHPTSIVTQPLARKNSHCAISSGGLTLRIGLRGSAEALAGSSALMMSRLSERFDARAQPHCTLTLGRINKGNVRRERTEAPQKSFRNADVPTVRPALRNPERNRSEKPCAQASDRQIRRRGPVHCCGPSLGPPRAAFHTANGRLTRRGEVGSEIGD